MKRYSNGMLLSDGIELSEFTDLIEDGEKLYHFSEVPSESEDCIILLATIAPEVKELLENMKTDDVQKMSDIILQEAIDNGFGIAKDDMTVIVAKLAKI